MIISKTLETVGPLLTPLRASANSYQGWLALDGRRALVFVPAVLALISIIMVNTVDLKDLEIDSDWVKGGSPGILRVKEPGSALYPRVPCFA